MKRSTFGFPVLRLFEVFPSNEIFFNITCFRATSGVAPTRGIFRRVRKIAKELMLASSCPSVLPYARPPAWNNSAAFGRIVMEFESICRTYVETVQVS